MSQKEQHSNQKECSDSNINNYNPNSWQTEVEEEDALK